MGIPEVNEQTAVPSRSLLLLVSTTIKVAAERDVVRVLSSRHVHRSRYRQTTNVTFYSGSSYLGRPGSS